MESIEAEIVRLILEKLNIKNDGALRDNLRGLVKSVLLDRELIK